MELLLDANISWRLITSLKIHFPDCFHVDKIGLAIPATDTEIWIFATEHSLVIVTNDDDFLNYINLKGFPPKIILLRTGNQTNDFIASVLIKHKDDIAALCTSAEYGLLEIY